MIKYKVKIDGHVEIIEADSIVYLGDGSVRFMKDLKSIRDVPHEHWDWVRVEEASQ